MRPLTLETTMRIWTMFLIGSFVGIFRAWAKHVTRERPVGERYQVVIFCALLLLQFPFVFAMERGNTDTVNVLLYTVAAVLFVRGRILLAGVAAGIAAGFKLSPIVAIVAMTGALVLARAPGGPVGLAALRRRRAGRLRADAASCSSARRSATCWMCCRSTPTRSRSRRSGVTRSRRSSAPTTTSSECSWAPACVAAWVWAGARALARGDAAMALAGSLAVSTYIPRTSYDYNLISTYPLLLLLFLRAQRTNRWALLAFGVFAIAGDRRLFSFSGAKVLTPGLHLALELAFLVVAAVVTAHPPEGDAPCAATNVGVAPDTDVVVSVAESVRVDSHGLARRRAGTDTCTGRRAKHDNAGGPPVVQRATQHR